MIWTLWAAVAMAQQLDPAFFAGSVYPVLEKAQCRACHTATGVASATRLHFPEKGAPPARIELFGLALDSLVDRAAPAKSLLAAKPTNGVRHTGGERIAPGSDDERLLRQWVDALAAAPEPAVASARQKIERSLNATKAEPAVRRLTHSQYNNTIRDLLGDHSKPALRFPPEDFVDGFRNQSRHQGMPPLLVETYSSTAERLATNAFRAGDTNGLVPCKPAAATDAVCRDHFIRTFGARAFRRPLREAEARRLADAFARQAARTNSFLEGARVVVEAMLQSPKFLFHAESGAIDYAIASRLAYLLWDTMPDRSLFEAAAKGELRTAAQREAAARRMLASPPATAALDEFFAQWLRFDRVQNASKERRRFPEFSPEFAAAMVEESRRLLHHLVANDRNFMEFFTADYGFLSSDLATLYKLPAPQGEFELVRFPAPAKRAGFLGQAAFLASTAGPLETSPTARGIFVREQLLCQHVPPPPPNINTSLPEISAEKPLTRRQRLAAHVENAACASCHRLMDPIGFGLESFDAIGRYREKEHLVIELDPSYRKPPQTVDLPLETGGEIAGLANSSFSDARQLGQILAASPVCQECIVRQVFRYAFGRMETSADGATIRSLTQTFRESGFRFRELLVALVRSPEFVSGLDDNRGQPRR